MTRWLSKKERHRQRSLADWRRRYGSKPIPNGKPLRYAPNTERMMYCWNEFWTASALWRRRDGIWLCVQAGEPIAWMTGKGAADAKLELARLGCQWRWM